MILKVPAALVQYLRRLPVQKHAPPRVVRALPALIAAMCLSTRKRTLTELGSFVLDERRDKSTVSRVMHDPCEELPHGYAQTKWVSEKMAGIAVNLTCPNSR